MGTQASPVIPLKPVHIQMQVGLDLFSVGENRQNIPLWNTLGNTYISSNNNNQLTPFYLLGAGYTIPLPRFWILNTDLLYAYIAKQTLSGNIWQLYQQRFNNLSYQYQITNHFFLYENSISFIHYHWQPLMLIGVGSAWNKASRYSEATLNLNAVPMQEPFGNNTRSQFAYTVGLGLAYQFHQSRILFLYRYLNAGHAQLGLTPLQNTQQHLSTSVLSYQILSLGWEFHFA